MLNIRNKFYSSNTISVSILYDWKYYFFNGKFLYDMHTKIIIDFKYSNNKQFSTDLFSIYTVTL